MVHNSLKIAISDQSVKLPYPGHDIFLLNLFSSFNSSKVFPRAKTSFSNEGIAVTFSRK